MAMGRNARSRPGWGAVGVRRAKVRDRDEVGAEETIRFTSSILPKWARRTKSLDALLPVAMQCVLRWRGALLPPLLNGAHGHVEDLRGARLGQIELRAPGTELVG